MQPVIKEQHVDVKLTECEKRGGSHEIFAGRGNVQTWVPSAEMRYVMRSGLKVLQVASGCIETGELQWNDVPVVENEVERIGE